MSGEMLVISFVREVNHVIMAATLDRRQNPQIQLQTLQSICPFTHNYGIGFTFYVGNHHIRYNPVSLELSYMAYSRF